MPRFPASASHLHAIPAAAYSALAGRLARHPGETYPLHVGDTWMEPAERCRMEDLTVAAHPGMHRYAPVQGLPALVDAGVTSFKMYLGYFGSMMVTDDQILQALRACSRIASAAEGS
ncbi:MAG TPA: hypothetical protein PKX99_09215, partial [Thermoanaerobaculia bacterium]|nr:hypothetical protein [Thermoanaerobaculia bacterium]